MGLDTGAERRERADWVGMARPQGGVDALSRSFPDAKPIKGVRDNGDGATRPVPTMGMSEPGQTPKRH